MKTWFNGDSEGKIKRVTSNKKGTLSDELSKADLIERKLRYNETELNRFQELKIQEVKLATNQGEMVKDRYQEEENVQRYSSIQMSSPFPPRRQTVEEVTDKVEQLVEVPTGIAPFPARRQTVEVTNKVEQLAESPIGITPFPPRRQSIAEMNSKVEDSVEIPFGATPFPKRMQLGESTNENISWKSQQVTLEHNMQYEDKEDIQLFRNKQGILVSARELAKEIVKTSPEKMEIEIPSPFSPNTYDMPKPVKNFNLGSVASLGEMTDYNNSDSYSREYEEKYEEDYEVESYPNLAFTDAKEVDVQSIQEDTKLIASKPSINLKANITISFDKEHTMNFNMNIGSIIMILNSSGEKFDFKITNDGEGGQNLNIVAPAHTIYEILALFE